MRVEKGNGTDRVVFRKMHPGQMFGEMSFLEPVPASASIVADDVRFDRTITFSVV